MIIPSLVELIGDEAFKDCLTLKKVVVFPYSYGTKIGKNVFNGCKSLIQIQCNPSKITFQSNPFNECPSLYLFVFDPNVKIVEKGWFQRIHQLTSNSFIQNSQGSNKKHLLKYIFQIR